jgi:hypothetical protein
MVDSLVLLVFSTLVILAPLNTNNDNKHFLLFSQSVYRIRTFALAHIYSIVGGDGLVVPSWLALCRIAQGSGFESQRGHLFLGISPLGEISQEGFSQELVSPPATSRYIGSVRIISEAPLVCPNGC